MNLHSLTHSMIICLRPILLEIKEKLVPVLRESIVVREKYNHPHLIQCGKCCAANGIGINNPKAQRGPSKVNVHQANYS